jgi:predicted transglutaminase-like cysteine proteinase
MKIVLVAFLFALAATVARETGALASTPSTLVSIYTPHEQQPDQDQIKPWRNNQVGSSAFDRTEPSVKSTALTEPFGLYGTPMVAGDLWMKWIGIEADIRKEEIILARCDANPEPCPLAARKFLAIVADGRAHTGRARIGVINRAINLAIAPMSDLDQWGVPDRWSAPLTTFTTGRGDCEDYAIAKYVALGAAGVPNDDLRLVIVRDVAVNEDHAVVAARLDGSWVVLDNRWLALAKDSDLPRMTALFAFDDESLKKLSLPPIAGAHGSDFHQF